MTSMSHEQGVTLLNAWIPTLVAESRTTRSVLAAVPADQGDYRPDPVCKSAMELVRHIAVSDNRFIEGVLTGIFPMTGNAPADGLTPIEIAEGMQHFTRRTSRH